MGSIKHPKKTARGQLGKIDAPLGKKLQAVKWGEYRLGDLFEKIKVTTLKYKTNDLPSVANKVFDLPALTAGIQNQGLNNYVPRENATILKNVISISANGANTGATFYQSKEFTVLQDSYAIKWIYSDVDLTDNQYLFLVGAISKRIYGNYEWTNKAGWERIRTNTISLPQTVDNQIDFDFMESFIRELEEERVRELEEERVRELAAYLTASGFADTTLTASEQAALNAFDTLEWGEFRIGDLFDVATGSLVSADKLLEGSIPRISVKTTDNGILGMYDTRSLHEARHHKNFISVNFFGNSFYHPYEASIEMKVHCLKIKNKDYTKESGLFITTLLNYALKDRFSYGDQLSSTDLKKLNIIIMLPVHDGSPDYAAMQALISAVQKLVIKDVVAYADKKIIATKAVVGKR